MSSTDNSSEIKVGLHIPSPQLYPLEHVVESAIYIEKNGYDSIWLADHTVSTPVGEEWPPVLEAWTTLAAIATQTKTLKLGTSVTDPHRRHPAILAQTATTLDIISNGRVILGIGAGEAMNLDPFGIPQNKPVSKMRETIEVMKKLWTGEVVEHKGEFFDIPYGCLVPTPKKKSIPVWVAAWRPRSLRVTAELGDGWLPSAYSPELLRADLETIRRCALKAGRNVGDIEPGCILPTILTEDSDEAKEAAQELSVRMRVSIAPSTLRSLGYEGPMEFDIVHWRPDPRSMRVLMEKAAYVPFDIVKRLITYGTPDECIDRFEEFAEAGLRHFIFLFLGSIEMRKSARRLCTKKVIPHLKQLS